MATTAETMIAAIETALKSNPAGTVEVDIDGTRIKYDRAQAIAEHSYWTNIKRQEDNAAAAALGANYGAGKLRVRL